MSRLQKNPLNAYVDNEQEMELSPNQSKCSSEEGVSDESFKEPNESNSQKQLLTTILSLAEVTGPDFQCKKSWCEYSD